MVIFEAIDKKCVVFSSRWRHCDLQKRFVYEQLKLYSTKHNWYTNPKYAMNNAK